MKIREGIFTMCLTEYNVKTNVYCNIHINFDKIYNLSNSCVKCSIYHYDSRFNLKSLSGVKQQC